MEKKKKKNIFKSELLTFAVFCPFSKNVIYMKEQNFKAIYYFSLYSCEALRWVGVTCKPHYTHVVIWIYDYRCYCCKEALVFWLLTNGVHSE